MPSYTGSEIARDSLKEIGVLDPTEDASAEMLDDVLVVGTDLMDEWRNDRLTISGVTRSVYSLTSGTQSYTIGSGGTFNQDWPLNATEWQQVRVKTLDAAYPNKLYYDRQFAAGLGNCLFHPIPDNNDVDVVLYTYVPSIISLVSGTTYNLRPGAAMAIKTNLAVELLEGRYKRPGDFSKLYRRAARSLASMKRSNYIPK